MMFRKSVMTKVGRIMMVAAAAVMVMVMVMTMIMIKDEEKEDVEIKPTPTFSEAVASNNTVRNCVDVSVAAREINWKGTF